MRSVEPEKGKHAGWTAQAHGSALTVVAGLCLSLQGCPSLYEWRHQNQWDSREQIWLSAESQVKLRAAQSRLFETADRRPTLEAIVATMQDLGFMVEVLDEGLGIVSGKKFEPLERPNIGTDLFYHLYDDHSLLIFTKSYHT